MSAIDNLNVIEVNIRLGKGHLSLRSRLLEALRSFARAISRISTVSSLAVRASAVTSGLARDGTTPNHVQARVDRNRNTVGHSSAQLEVSVRRHWILPEALSNSAGLDA